MRFFQSQDFNFCSCITDSDVLVVSILATWSAITSPINCVLYLQHSSDTDIMMCKPVGIELKGDLTPSS